MENRLFLCLLLLEGGFVLECRKRFTHEEKKSKVESITNRHVSQPKIHNEQHAIIRQDIVDILPVRSYPIDSSNLSAREALHDSYQNKQEVQQEKVQHVTADVHLNLQHLTDHEDENNIPVKQKHQEENIVHHIVPKHEDDRYDDKQRHESRVNYHDDDEDHHGGHGHGHGHGHEDHHEEHDHDHDDHHDEGHHKCDHDHHEDHHDDHDLHDDHHDEYDHHEEHEDFHRHCDRHEERHSDDAHHNDDVHLSEHSHHGAEQGYSRHDDDNDYPDHLNLNNDDDHSKSDRGNYHSPEHQKQELDVYKTGHRYSQEREHQDSHEYDGHSEYETVKTAEHADNHGSNHIASVPHITIALHDRSDGNPDHATNDNLIKKLIEQLTDSLNRFQAHEDARTLSQTLSSSIADTLLKASQQNENPNHITLHDVISIIDHVRQHSAGNDNNIGDNVHHGNVHSNGGNNDVYHGNDGNNNIHSGNDGYLGSQTDASHYDNHGLYDEKHDEDLIRQIKESFASLISELAHNTRTSTDKAQQPYAENNHDENDVGNHRNDHIHNENNYDSHEDTKHYHGFNRNEPDVTHTKILEKIIVIPQPSVIHHDDNSHDAKNQIIDDNNHDVKNQISDDNNHDIKNQINTRHDGDNYYHQRDDKSDNGHQDYSSYKNDDQLGNSKEVNVPGTTEQRGLELTRLAKELQSALSVASETLKNVRHVNSTPRQEEWIRRPTNRASENIYSNHDVDLITKILANDKDKNREIFEQNIVNRPINEHVKNTNDGNDNKNMIYAESEKSSLIHTAASDNIRNVDGNHENSQNNKIIGKMNENILSNIHIPLENIGRQLVNVVHSYEADDEKTHTVKETASHIENQESKSMKRTFWKKYMKRKRRQ